MIRCLYIITREKIVSPREKTDRWGVELQLRKGRKDKLSSLKCKESRMGLKKKKLSQNLNRKLSFAMLANANRTIFLLRMGQNRLEGREGV